jgi:hypothetical protein
VTCPLHPADIRLQAEAFADFEARGGLLAFDAWAATKDFDVRTAALIARELPAARVRLALGRHAKRNGAA